MEKEEFLLKGGGTMLPTWNSMNFGVEFQSNDLNCSSEQLPNSFLNPNWESSMDQTDPFESTLSSIVSSPAASNAGTVPGDRENIAIGELIGRLGSICSSGNISPHSYINGNNSTNNSCYSTPLNSPPKLNLSVIDHQIGGSTLIPGNHLPNQPALAQFSTDPGFAERAARFSCFGNRNFGGLNGQLGLNENELPYKSMSKLESGKLSRVSSNQSLKIAGSQVGCQETKANSPLDGVSVSDKKICRLSRSSSPENGEFVESREESSVSEQVAFGENVANGNGRKRKSIPKAKAKENSSPSANNAQAAAVKAESKAKRSKSGESATGEEKDTAKAKSEPNGSDNQKQSKDNLKPPEPPKDYIHVRARRGQATDSHSLAERVRREKISERMKFLQDLVPGCSKVTGKAVMLDEIINYVQSLQRQVEFLSMKLSTVNPRMEFNMEALLSKDMFQTRGSLPNMIYPLESSVSAFPYELQSQQGPSLQGSICNGSQAQFSLNSYNAVLHRNPSMQLPPMDGFGEASAQVSALWEDDLQSVVQMGFGQNQPQTLHGSLAATQMKIEP